MADFFEALQVSYNSNIDIVPVSGTGVLTYEQFYAAVAQYFNIKNKFYFVHSLSGAEIKREFFRKYVQRYEHNLILVVKEDVLDEITLPIIKAETQPVESFIKEEPCFQETFLENASVAVDSFEHAARQPVESIIKVEPNLNDPDISSNDYETKIVPTPTNREIESSQSEQSVDFHTAKRIIDCHSAKKINQQRRFEAVRNLILSSEKELISRYRNNRRALKNPGRIRISKRIINHLLDKEPQLVLFGKDFETLAKIILSIFNKNTEKASDYFIPAQNNKQAKGKLYNAYTNKKKLLTQAGLLIRRKLCLRNKTTNSLNKQVMENSS